MKRQLQVFFSGSVQGVGFRFTAEQTARQFDVCGFVRNLPDGRVELVAEGEERELQEFLRAVKESRMQPNIRGSEVSWKEPENSWKTFSVRP